MIPDLEAAENDYYQAKFGNFTEEEIRQYTLLARKVRENEREYFAAGIGEGAFARSCGRSVCLTELKGYQAAVGQPVIQPRRPNSRLDKVRHMFQKVM